MTFYMICAYQILKALHAALLKVAFNLALTNKAVGVVIMRVGRQRKTGCPTLILPVSTVKWIMHTPFNPLHHLYSEHSINVSHSAAYYTPPHSHITYCIPSLRGTVSSYWCNFYHM